ncbi:MAG: TonB-dependent receptor [Bryobacterales bacterium]|nr:TonB-dependent receptor [Bryobacterales bacterium]
MMRFTFALLVSLALPLAAQQGRGTILGTVTDASGAAVPNVKISVTNTGTNFSFQAETSQEGFYTTPAIPIGAYTVSAEAAGFKKVTRTGITLQVDQRAQVNMLLEIGAVTDSVEVNAQAELVDTASGTIGKVIENRRVVDLPVNGRSAFALAQLAPAVKSTQGNSQGFLDRGLSVSLLSINGGPSAVNAMEIDGGNNNQAYYNEANANPATDSIQEFKVQSNTMSAEFGFTLGGVLNVVTKSGTNQYHGSLYSYMRNSALDARDTFALTKGQFSYNQPGGSLGGPIDIPKIYKGKDKTFFFFNWEEYMYRTSATSFTTVPITAWKQGDFSNLKNSSGAPITIYDPNTTIANPNGSGYVRTPFANNIIPTSRLDPVAQAAQKILPEPNAVPINAFSQTNNFYQVNRNATDSNQYTIRGDHRFSDKNLLFFRFMYFEHNPYPLASNFVPLEASGSRTDDLQNKNVVISDTHTFSPNWVNEFRAGLMRNYLNFKVTSADRNWPEKLGLPNTPQDVFPAFETGFGGLNPQGTYGQRGSTTPQFVNTVSHIAGKHTTRFGVDVRRLLGDNLQKSYPSGQFQFNTGLTTNPQAPTNTGFGYAQFMTGAAGTTSVGTYMGESQRGYSISTYVQDDWKVSRRLTLNLGLRYDYQDPAHEMNNGLSNFDPIGINPENKLKGRMTYAGVNGAPTSPFAREKRAFAPRVGYSYDLTGRGRTVIRGGYALFFANIFNVSYFGQTGGFANTTTAYTAPANNNVFKAFDLKNGLPYAPTQPLGAKLGPGYLLSNGVATDQNDQSVPYSQQWNISLQHQLPLGIVLEASYSANRGTHLVSGSYDMNQLNPQYLSLGLALQDAVPNPYAGIVPGNLGGATITRAQSLKPYPYYSGISVRNPHLGNSMYHAMLLNAEKRFSNGFTMLASFTGSKLMSDSVVSPLNYIGEQTGTVGYQNGNFNRRAERSLDPTDLPRRFVLSALYELPFGKGKRFAVSNAALEAIVGGWQVGTITTIQSGLPLQVRGANNFLADRPNSTGVSAAIDDPTQYKWLRGDVFVNPANYTYGNVGRVLPDVRAPGIRSFDLSMVKNTRIMERMNFQLRLEAFNAPNLVNLGYPNVSFAAGANGQNSNALFGRITSDRGPRNVQVALRLTF